MKLLSMTAALLLSATSLACAEPLKVVASFSILGDMVTRIGGDKVMVTTIVGADGDAHVYQPTPADAEAVTKADVVVVNGLGFEGFLTRLLDSAEYRGPVITAAEKVTPRMGFEEEGEAVSGSDGHDHGGMDPHAWQSLRNAGLYVTTIRDGLCAADPADCPSFTANAKTYGEEIAALDSAIRSSIESIPQDRRVIITSHDAFGYFGDSYGISFLAPQGISTESEASAGGVGKLIEQIRSTGARVLFFENIADPRLIEQIAAETGARVGGALYSDALSPAGEPGATYLDMMKYNANTLISAINEAS